MAEVLALRSTLDGLDHTEIRATCTGQYALENMEIKTGAVYIWAGQGAEPINQQLLASSAQVLEPLQLPWILYGDWQMEPEDMLGTSWLQAVSAHILMQLAALQTTCWQGQNGVIH